MTKLNNAIWDFDGTLADTYPVMLKNVMQTLSDFKLTGYNQTDVYKKIKIHSINTLAAELEQQGKVKKASFIDHYQNLERISQTDVKLYPDAKTVLKTISNGDGGNYLLTHRNDLVIDMLRKNDVLKYFKGRVDGNDKFPRKPKPDSINYLVTKYKLNPATSAMIGDRSLDIQAGENAGVKTIYFDVDNFHDNAGSDYVVKNLKDILKLY